MALADTYFKLDRPYEAEVAQRKSIELLPGFWNAHSLLGDILVSQGRPNDALAEYQKEMYPGFHRRGAAIAYLALGRMAEANKALDEFERNDAALFAYSISAVHARRGESDLAFKWLERAFVQHDSNLLNVHRDPWFASLHGDPRWKAFLRKMKLPEFAGSGTS
jgi:adenylate cyclase